MQSVICESFLNTIYTLSFLQMTRNASEMQNRISEQFAGLRNMLCTHITDRSLRRSSITYWS